MNECKMSLFQNPIAPQRDPQGRILKAATLTPAFGIGCKIFTIAGPVILYGIVTSWAFGVVYWVWTLM